MLPRLLAILALLQAAHFISGQFINAKCRIDPVTTPGADASQPVSGVIFLSQSLWGGKTKLLVRLEGFTKTSNVTRHGFHVHENGNVSNQCAGAGAHYNPAHVTHGAPWDTTRHVGDLGNVEVKCGRVRAIVRDLVVSLNSRDDNSILNRTLVVHALVDDLGKGNESDSLTTGHAGARLGCCVVRKIEDFKAKPVTLACAGKSARKYPQLCELKERIAAAKKRRLANKDDTDEDDSDEDDDDAACKPPRPAAAGSAAAARAAASPAASWREARKENRKDKRGSSSSSDEKSSSSSKRRPYRRRHHNHRDRD